MLMEDTLTTLQLEWAVEDKRDADATLAGARLQLTLARADLDAVVAEHNALYRERLAAQAAASFERDRQTKDADWEESASRLESLAEWLEDESRRLDLRYYRANDAVYDAERRLKDARDTARARGRDLHAMLEKFREGLVVDAMESAPGDYDWDSYDDCDCPLCRSYLYDDYDDWFDEDAHEEEERLTLEDERSKRLTQKRKSYKLRRLRRRSKR